ncbi:hypothetical protein CHIBA101_2117 [Actinomyces sp. Chiba101]|nr:hypothetical protein CHIBA101_2117 [Actinomyces sp. Chiba101]
MCSRRTPWRSTQAFWAPMAMMSPNPVPNPVSAGASETGGPVMLPNHRRDSARTAAPSQSWEDALHER